MSTLGIGSLLPDGSAASELSLGDVLARGTRVEWFEAVAVVRATWEALTAASEDRRIPDLGQIWLTRDGTIRLSGGSHEDEPVRRMGQLLQALLNQSDPPVTLRLLAGNATVPEPVYAGVQQLDEAIAYFERPDRSAVLRALFARSVDAKAPASGQTLRSVDDVAPLPTPHPEPVLALRGSLRRIAPLAASVIIATLAAVVLARAYLHGERLPTGKIAGVARLATNSLTGAVLDGMSAVTERVGLGRLTAPAESGSARMKTDVASHPTARRHAPARPVLKGIAIGQAFDLQNTPLAFAPIAADLRPTAATTASTKDVPKVLPVATARAVDTSIYSADYANVVPPVAIRPQLPRDLPAGVVATDLSRIEVTVERDGTVESVKLLPGARSSSVKEAMLLSAAKTWRFAPATKDHVPVRYRKMIWIVTN
jgi:hypothetical protein